MRLGCVVAILGLVAPGLAVPGNPALPLKPFGPWTTSASRTATQVRYTNPSASISAGDLDAPVGEETTSAPGFIPQPGSGQSLSFGWTQVDFYQDGRPVVLNSEWGEITVVYGGVPQVGWLNIVQDPSRSSRRWIVQNHPLLPDSMTGVSTFRSSSYFSLGVTRGADVKTIHIDFAVTPDPLTQIPGTLNSFIEPVGNSSAIINAGVPSTEVTLNPPPANINFTNAFTTMMSGFHQGMPNVVQPTNFCGPGAAANSLHWLNAVNRLDLRQALDATQAELGPLMNNKNDGNWDDDQTRAKLQYIKKYNLQLEVHYTGGVKLPTAGNYTDPVSGRTARNDGRVTWDWLQNEFKKGQDIELMTDTHWVVMEGFISWTGVCLFVYRDDPYQHGANSTRAERDVIQNRHVWTYFNSSTGTTNINRGDEPLRAAVAESPGKPQ